MFIHAQVTTGAKMNRVMPKSFDHFAISTRKPAKMNLANNHVRELLANHLNVPLNKVRIINGHHSPSKLFSIAD